MFATCAVVATALAQIFTNTYQKSLECDAMQLLYHTSPIIAMVQATPVFLYAVYCPLFILYWMFIFVSGYVCRECSVWAPCLTTFPSCALSSTPIAARWISVRATIPSRWYYGLNLSIFCALAISCLFALGVNISNYLVLGKTSPMTYQVWLLSFLPPHVYNFLLMHYLFCDRF